MAIIAMVGIQPAAQAELNLHLPKQAVPAATPASHNNLPNGTSLDDERAPEGYQASSQCRDGMQVTGMRNVNGKQFYKCERMRDTSVPVVRDAERYDRTPSHCGAGMMGPGCSNLPPKGY